MCGNIKRLRFPDRAATAEKIDAKMAASVKTMLSGLSARRANAVQKALFQKVAKEPKDAEG